MDNLSILEQFTQTLLLESTIDKVRNQFLSETEIVPVDAFDVNFRLLHTGQTINLELLASGPLGHYFKPIGFYDKSLNVFLLKEFEYSFGSLSSKGIITNINVNKLSNEDNAVIAAFSINTIISALRVLNEVMEKGFEPEFKNGMMIPPNLRYDRNLEVNGLECELIMSFDGTPQFYLDDKYEVDGAIGSYGLNESGMSINPTINYKGCFDKLASLKLLSAYKRI